TGPGIVYVEPFPRTGAKYQIPSPGGHPFWSPKGNEIILNSGPGQATLVPFTAAPRVAFGRPQVTAKRGRLDGNPTTTRRNADMMPDGQYILGVASTEVRGDTGQQSEPAAIPSSITVVINWFTELQQRVPTR